MIDFHMHLFPDSLAEKALSKLADVSGIRPYTHGTVSSTLKQMDAWGVDSAVILHIATSPAQQANVNRFALSVNEDESGRFFSFGSVHFESPDAAATLARLKAAGLRGIKLHPDYQGFDVTDRRLYPIYEEAARLGLLITFHAGLDPISSDHIHCTPAMLAQVLQDFPSLRVICAHFGSFRLWDEVETHLVGKKVFFDTAFAAGALDPAQALRIISRHGAEQILFGSDCPWQDSQTAFQFIDRLPLTQREKQSIFSGNARELLGV